MARKKPVAKSKEQLTCFVVIGFGMKTDYATGRVLNLDLTYQKLIKPAFDNVGIRCFRAIDVNVTGSIDKLMYKWIYHADYVMADLSTMNANVFYELGVRHAQRPNTTLIMTENEAFRKLPFDLSHTIIYGYEHLGESIADEEAKRFVDLLTKQLKVLIDSPPEEDSPVYTYLPGMKPPTWEDPKVLIAELEATLAAREKMAGETEVDLETLKQQTIAVIVESAEAAKNEKNFEMAISLFQTATENDEQDMFLWQRLALVTYKNKEKDEDQDAAIAALQEAEQILIKHCELLVSTDPETLGLAGAINKRLYERTDNNAYFEKSVFYYERGFYIKQDYYNGINVAYMYTVKAARLAEEGDEFNAVVNYGHANLIRKKVAEICRRLIDSDTFASRGDQEWVYLTLYEAYFGMGQQDEADKYMSEINALASDFGKETFHSQKENLGNVMEQFHNNVRLPSGDAAAGTAPTAKEAGEAAAAADQSSAIAVAAPTTPAVSRQPGGPISIDLGSHQDKPVKSIEVNCKVEFE